MAGLRMGEAGNDFPLHGIHGQVCFKPIWAAIVHERIVIFFLLIFICIQIPGPDSTVQEQTK